MQTIGFYHKVIAFFLCAMIGNLALAAEINAVVAKPKLKLTSPSFHNDDEIPVNYTCHGQDISPPLAWSEIPNETQSLLLFLVDPEAPQTAKQHIHWLVYNIPPSNNLDENQIPENAVIGVNSKQHQAYEGPCQADGKIHHYYFVLYALDYILAAEPKSFEDLPEDLHQHILAEGKLAVTR